MAVDQYQNAYVTKLRESCTSDADVIFVDTPPTITQGILTLEFSNQTKREIIHFTGVDGYKLTGVTRGLEGTVAQSHSASSDIRQNITAGMVTRMMNQIVDAVYPIGSIYMSATLSTPEAVSAAIGGDWVAFGIGKTLVSVDENDGDFNTPEKTGGEKRHTLSVAEMPSHNHDGNRAYIRMCNGDGYYCYTDIVEGAVNITHYRGGNQSHNNLQPYITTYMYKRIG